MGEIIDCKTLSQKIKDDVKERVNKLKEQGIMPKLTVLTNPDDEPSKAYVRNKRKVCEEVGIEFEEIPFNKGTEYNKLLQLANANNPVVVQLPINKDVDTGETWEVIYDYYCCSERDVDGFFKDSLVYPATAKGVIRIFDEINYDLESKHICIIGRGLTCARPLVEYLQNDEDATITICNSHTKDLESITSKCDVVVSCVGKPHLITEDHIKEGAIVINVGLSINSETNKLTGDVDFAACKDKACYITKNIGGVGLLTTACLAENVVELYERRT